MPILSQTQIEQINESSLRILERIGVRIDHDGLAAGLAQAGAKRTSRNRLVLPRGMVRDALAECSPVVRLADRSAQAVELRAGGETVFWPGNALYIVEQGEARLIQSTDFVRLTRVMDALPNVHAMVGTNIDDVPPLTRDFVGFRLMAEHTRKHFRPVIFTAKGAAAIIEMAEILLDGATIREKPIVSFGYTIVSPLRWSETALELFEITSGKGIPMMVNAEPVAGATSPVTLASCLALANAEALSGVVITQLLEPGRPIVFNLGFAHTMDMRTAVTRTGGPENGLLAAAGAEIAAYHGLPSASWMSTESLTPDSQAAYEKMITGLMHALSTVNIIWGVGQLESQRALSCEQAVIDNEIASYVLRGQRGIEVSNDTLAFDVIEQEAERSDFIGHPHTLEHFRSELYFPQIANTLRRETWGQRGAKQLEIVAQETVEAILSEEEEPILDDDTRRQLAKVEAAWAERIG